MQPPAPARAPARARFAGPARMTRTVRAAPVRVLSSQAAGVSPAQQQQAVSFFFFGG
jgi:hypothetical protein